MFDVDCLLLVIYVYYLLFVDS